MGLETYQALVGMLAEERTRIDRAFDALRRVCDAGAIAPDAGSADHGVDRRGALDDSYRRFHAIAVDLFGKEEPFLCALEERDGDGIAGHRRDHHRIAEWLASVARELEAGAAAADIRPLLELAYLWLSDHRETHDAALVEMYSVPL